MMTDSRLEEHAFDRSCEIPVNHQILNYIISCLSIYSLKLAVLIVDMVVLLIRDFEHFYLRALFKCNTILT